jgi:HEAT repeats
MGAFSTEKGHLRNRAPSDHDDSLDQYLLFIEVLPIMRTNMRGLGLIALFMAATVGSGTFAYQNYTAANGLRIQIARLERILEMQQQEFDAKIAEAREPEFTESVPTVAAGTQTNSTCHPTAPSRQPDPDLTDAVIAHAVEDFSRLDPHGRAEALRELAKLARLAHDSRARETLLEALNDQHAPVRQEAANGIGLLQDPDLLLALDPLTNDPDAKVRQAVLHAVVRISGSPDLSGPIVTKFLSDANENVTTQALRNIARLNYQPALDHVSELAFSDNLEVAASAAYTARSLGNDAIADNAIPYVAQGLDSDDSRERSKALERIGDIGGRAAIPYLQSALVDPDPKVRADAQFYLDDVNQQIESES